MFATFTFISIITINQVIKTNFYHYFFPLFSFVCLIFLVIIIIINVIFAVATFIALYICHNSIVVIAFSFSYY